MSRRQSFRIDQRGAVAFEMLIVFLALMMGLLIPLADMAITGFRFISAHEALRDFGQYLQYHEPPDITAWNGSTWQTSLPITVHGYTISTINLVVCGDAVSQPICSTTNTASPRYYKFTTSLTLAPMLLTAVLCVSTNANPCTYTIAYSERFQ